MSSQQSRTPDTGPSWEDIGDVGVAPEGAEWVKRRLSESDIDALVEEYDRTDRNYDADYDMGVFVLYRDGYTPPDYANVVLLREAEREREKGKPNRHLDFWHSLRPLHEKGCRCLECKKRDYPELVTEEEQEELEKLRKTVTVATRDGLAADHVEELYVGIGIPRAEILQQPQFEGWYVLEAYVELAPKVKAGKTSEEVEKTPDTVFGSNLMSLFRQGCLIGYDASHGTYLVGQIAELLERGISLPRATFVTQNIDHWLPLDRINIQMAHEAEKGKGKRKMPKDKTQGEGAEGTTATATKTKEQTACACGCGTMTASKFAMGHDSKLRGQIHAVLEGRMEVSVIPPIAYEKCGTKTAPRFNPTSGQLEDVSVPDAHFTYDKGEKAFRAAQDKATKDAEKAAEKARADAEKAAAAASANAEPEPPAE